MKMPNKTIPKTSKIYPHPQVTLTVEQLFSFVNLSIDNWYAINADGSGHYFENKPFVEGEFWGWDGGSTTYGYLHDMTGVDWRECIYCRPDIERIVIGDSNG